MSKSDLNVFVSSTCYDLKSIRDRLEEFISNMGYNPILSERSDILYDPRDHTHTSCVKAVQNSDFLICIIGGRFGGKANMNAVSQVDFDRLKSVAEIELDEAGEYSITQVEVMKALECDIPVYTFIAADVYEDHGRYVLNKKTHDEKFAKAITYSSIEKDGTAGYIFDFIDLLRKRDHGNSIFPFIEEKEIEEVLKKQWSAFFHVLIKEQHEKVDQRANKESKDNELSKLNSKFDFLLKVVQQFVDRPDENHDERVHQQNYATINSSDQGKQNDNSSNQRIRRILWVDDYPQNNMDVVSFLSDCGVCFDLCLTTEEGIQHFDRLGQYDLIITDMGRGENRRAGLDLLQELKSHGCTTPVIVYSDTAVFNDLGREAMSLGAYSLASGEATIIQMVLSMFDLRLNDQLKTSMNIMY